MSVQYPDFESGEILRGTLRTRVFQLGWPLAQASSFAMAQDFKKVWDSPRDGAMV
jgi:hypothetical protein